VENGCREGNRGRSQGACDPGRSGHRPRTTGCPGGPEPSRTNPSESWRKRMPIRRPVRQLRHEHVSPPAPGDPLEKPHSGLVPEGFSNGSPGARSRLPPRRPKGRASIPPTQSHLEPKNRCIPPSPGRLNEKSSVSRQIRMWFIPVIVVRLLQFWMGRKECLHSYSLSRFQFPTQRAHH